MPAHKETLIELTVGDEIITGTLFDNPAANALVQQLPLTLLFDDLNSIEKLAALASPLPMDGMPPGHAPEAGDIGYWAPGGKLVLYYAPFPYWEGIARLGSFDGIASIKAQTGSFTVTIAPEGAHPGNR
ncbi:cyclophilin-like fold protein [Conyzicola sp.]|uniref:cyclophilin-like fold protein n=1 Tax=Conyzicola sp. TaxID=1969404 RepID=UPI003988EDD1